MNYALKTFKKCFRASVKSLLVIMIALSLALQTGCFEKTKNDDSNSGLKSGDIISKETPWFDSEFMEIDGGYKDKGDVEYLELEFVGCTDKAIVIHYSGNYVKAADNSNHIIDDIIFIDPDTGKEITRTDISEYKMNGSEIANISIEGGQLVCEIKTKDNLTGKKAVKCLLVDNSGTITIKDRPELVSDKNKTDEYYIDGFAYSLSYDFSRAVYTVIVKSPEGNDNSFEISENGVKIYEVKTFILLDDGKILVPTYTDKGYMYFVYDPQSNDLKNATKKFKWLDNDFNKIKGHYIDCNAGYADDDSIYVIDTKDKCAKEVFNKNFCKINCPDLRSLMVIRADSSCITLFDIKGSDDPRHIIETACIYSFKKADFNPNAGKTVLELATEYDTVPDGIAQAIIDYNARNDTKCYVITTGRYVLDSEDVSESNDDIAVLKQRAEISNQMAIDILNGNGPDIFINISSIHQINNSNCLVDLTEIANSLPDDQYFTNIIKTASIKGANYQLPLTFLLTGVQVSSNKKIPDDGVTLKEWPSFVSEYCNGIDPIYMNRDYYFMILYANMSDKFNDADVFTQDNKDLYELAQYCKFNVSKAGTSSDDYFGSEQENMINAVYSVMGGIYDYFDVLPSNGKSSFIGLPSTDGRGVAYIPSDSVAISADSKHIDECKDFVRLLFSEKYQEMLADCGGNVVNRKAFESGCKKYQEYFSKDKANRTERGLLDSDIEDYKKIANSASHMFEINSQMLFIVTEEMQAYFSDQKQYDEVIRIIADKAKKMSSENA